MRTTRQHVDFDTVLAVDISETIGTGVTAADDHYSLVARSDLGALDRKSANTAVLLGQVVHRLVDATEFPSRCVQVAPHGGSDGEHDGVIPVT